MAGQWQTLGEIVVTDSWQQFGQDSFDSESFKITTAYSDADWELKVRSGIYLKFSYMLNFNEVVESKKFYIPASKSPVIYDFPIPKNLRNDGILFRSVKCILSSKYAGKFSLSSFVTISLKVEESIRNNQLTDRELIEQIALDVTNIKELIGG